MTFVEVFFGVLAGNAVTIAGVAAALVGAVRLVKGGGLGKWLG